MVNITEWHLDSHRKSTGGLNHARNRKTKSLYEKGGFFTSTTIGDARSVVLEKRGSTEKTKLYSGRISTIFTEGTGKSQKGAILRVVENSANRLYTRRNIITKGAVIEAEIGQKKVFARVTSRPGQHGTIQAVELKDFKEAKAEKQEKAKAAAKERKEKPKTHKEAKPVKHKKAEKTE